MLLLIITIIFLLVSLFLALNTKQLATWQYFTTEARIYLPSFLSRSEFTPATILQSSYSSDQYFLQVVAAHDHHNGHWPALAELQPASASHCILSMCQIARTWSPLQSNITVKQASHQLVQPHVKPFSHSSLRAEAIINFINYK